MNRRGEVIEKGWNSGKREDETDETENLISLRNKDLISWMKQE